MAMVRPPMIDDDGTGTTGTVLNNAWYQALCDAIDTGHLSPPVARTDVTNTFASSDQVFANTGGFVRLTIRDGSQPANARQFALVNSGQLLIVQVTDDANNQQLASLTLNRSGDALIARDILEKGRTTPMGHWIAIPFNAANFTASGATWTVTSGNVLNNRYTLIGKTVIVSTWIQASSLSAGTGQLTISYPFNIPYLGAPSRTTRCISAGANFAGEVFGNGANGVTIQSIGPALTAGSLEISFTLIGELS